MFEITQRMQVIFVSLIAAAIEGELLAAYYGQKVLYTFGSFYYELDDSITIGFKLQIASAALMIFGFVVLVFLGMMKKKFQKFFIFGNFCIIIVAIIIGCIGMAQTYQYYVDDTYDGFTFNLPLGYWFIEVMLMVVAAIFDYIVYFELSNPQKSNQTSHSEMTPTPVQK